jgi:hypothetical protein
MSEITKYDICKNIALLYRNLVSIQTVYNNLRNVDISKIYKIAALQPFKKLLKYYITTVGEKTTNANSGQLYHYFNIIEWLYLIRDVSNTLETQTKISTLKELSSLSITVLNQVLPSSSKVEPKNLDLLSNHFFIKYVVTNQLNTGTYIILKETNQLDNIPEFFSQYRKTLSSYVDISSLSKLLLEVTECVATSLNHDLFLYPEVQLTLNEINKIDSHLSQQQQLIVQETVDNVRNIPNRNINKNLSFIKYINTKLLEYNFDESSKYHIISKLLNLDVEIPDNIFEKIQDDKLLISLCIQLNKDTNCDVIETLNNFSNSKYEIVSYGYKYLVYNETKVSDVIDSSIAERSRIIVNPYWSDSNLVVYSNKYFDVYKYPLKYKYYLCRSTISDSLQDLFTRYDVDVNFVTKTIEIIIELIEDILQEGNRCNTMELISITDFDGYVGNRAVITRAEDSLTFLDTEYKKQLTYDICAIILSHIKFKTIKTKADTVSSQTYTDLVKQLNCNYVNRNVIGFVHEICKSLDNNNYYSSTSVFAYYFLTDIKMNLQDIIQSIYDKNDRSYIVESILNKLT